MSETLAFGLARVGKCLVGIPLEHMSEVCRLCEMHALMVSSPILLGGLDLRGHLIPVLDLHRICDLPPAAPGGFATIVRLQDRLVAFPVDEVLGMVNLDVKKLQSLGQGAEGTQVVKGVVLEGGNSISILEVEAIFTLPGVYSVEAPQVTQSRTLDGHGTPMLIFEVGGAHFSVRAEDVYGTVPRQSVEVNAMSSGACMGSITHHGRRVPVLNTAQLFGVGVDQCSSQTEIVVLRGGSGRLVGLAVQAILDVQSIDLRGLIAVPRAVGIAWNYFSGLMLRPDGRQIYTIATDRFLADPQIESILTLSYPVAGTEVATEAATLVDGEGTTRTGLERYLVFKAGRIFATPLSQVSCIQKLPTDLVPLTNPSQGLIGFFTQGQSPIPLVDLNEHLGFARSDSGLDRVLLTGNGEEQLGFRVERVFSIESAAWVLQGMSQGSAMAEPLVQLGRGAAGRALPILDLEALASTCFAPRPESGVMP